jgi:hypothetical protein
MEIATDKKLNKNLLAALLLSLLLLDKHQEVFDKL